MYRIRATGELKSQGEIRGLYPNTALPAFWTPEINEELGIDPVLEAPRPENTDPFKTVIEVAPVQDSLGNWVRSYEIVDTYKDIMDEAGVVVTTKAQQEADRLEVLKKERKDAVDAARLTKEKEGVSYTFANGAKGTIQTSREVDIRNVSGIVTTALILQAQGVTTPVIPFRDLENVTHQLTPTDAITMGMAVQQFISGTYETAWTKKQAIDAATTYADMMAVSMTF